MQKENKKDFGVVNNQLDFILCIVVLLLLAAGIIMVLSASAPSALSTTGDSYTYVKKQLLFAGLGIIAMFVLSRLDFKIFLKHYKAIYAFSTVILLLVLVPGLGVSVKGATRWIAIGPIQFQPSEITKIGLIIFYAGYLNDTKGVSSNLGKGFIVPLLLLAPPVAILFVVQNHMSVSLVIGLVVIFMMFASGRKIKHFVVGVSIIVIGLVAFFGGMQLTGSSNFRLSRITTFFDPWSESQGTGYQTVQSLYAIGSGGAFGLGLGNSKQKYLYIPEPHNDYIFAILAEEMGFFGCVVVIGLFALFVWRGIVIAMKCQDQKGSLVAIGITAQVAVQACMNIAVVTNTIPATGISLPFFSYGGTALLLLLAEVGILLNISRYCKKV